MKKALPWAFIGFASGVALGFMWGEKAKSRLGESISTSWRGGVFSLHVDTVDAAKAGLPDLLRNL